MDPNSWATALDGFWGDLEPGSRALLTLEPSLLMHVAQFAGHDFKTVEEAESSFLQIARAYIRGKGQGPWEAEPYRPGTPPRFLLQIAVQVYAASKMADAPDGHHTAAAYYVQLEELVGDSGAKERFNANDQGEHHQTLWRGRLAEWARHKGLVLELPADRDGAGRHVQLPKSQAALRIGDLERLPLFFHKCLFDPMGLDEAKVEGQIERIGEQLRRRKHDSDCFSSWARKVLDDQLKFPIAVVQVEQAFREWDGRLVLRDAGRRSQRKANRTRWVWLDVRLTQRRIRAVSGVSSVTAKALLPDDFALLLSGKETDIGDRLEFHDGLTLFAYEPEDAAFKQADYVDAGNAGMLLAGRDHFANWRHVLNCDRVAVVKEMFSGDDEVNWQLLTGLPVGCRGVVFRVRDRLPAAESIPEAWRPFLRLPSARLSLSGGLRIGREEHFVAGAGPQLVISGKYPPPFIYVDGKQIRISGRIVQIDQFSQVGDHEIIARYDGKTIEKRFRVSHPENVLPCAMPPRCWAFDDDRWPTWESTINSDDEYEVSKDEGKPQLFGIRGVGLEATNDQPSESLDDRLTAIRLLSGMPLREKLNTDSDHPLVRQLMMMQPATQRELIEVTP